MADKFMYFKEPEGKVLFNYRANNKEYRAARGFWQEFDPYRKKETNNEQKKEREFSQEEKEILGIFDEENTTKKDNYKTDVMSLNIDDIEEAPVTSFNNNTNKGIPGAVPMRKRRN